MRAWSEISGGFWVGRKLVAACKLLKDWSHPPGLNRRPADYESWGAQCSGLTGDAHECSERPPFAAFMHTGIFLECSPMLAILNQSPCRSPCSRPPTALGQNGSLLLAGSGPRVKQLL
jgi:hypothetical protein